MIKNIFPIVVVMLTIFSPTRSQSQTIMTCVMQEFNVCEGGQCRKIQDPNRNWIELQQNKLKKCDGKSCDTYESDVVRSGEFTNISIGNRGYLLKIDNNKKFVEVSTLGLLTIVKNGQCS